MGKNHTIKSFRVSDETYEKFEKAVEEIGLKRADVSRLLFNKALKELTALAQENGWDELNFSVRDMR